MKHPAASWSFCIFLTTSLLRWSSKVSISLISCLTDLFSSSHCFCVPSACSWSARLEYIVNCTNWYFAFAADHLGASFLFLILSWSPPVIHHCVRHRACSSMLSVHLFSPPAPEILWIYASLASCHGNPGEIWFGFYIIVQSCSLSYRILPHLLLWIWCPAQLV